jgi:DNA-binding NarL/FixJ family response regulator
MPSPRTPWILVVDDSAAVRGAICNFIDRATPFKACCEAEDGVAAIEKAKERTPALVILDLSMPRMNGVEAASVLRGMLPGTKIVGFTTFGEEFRRSLLAGTAFDMILSKHEGLAKLAETINALLPAADPLNS